MGRGAVPIIYEGEVPFTPGKANLLLQGGDAAIIACGETVYHSLQAAQILKEQGINVSVYDMHTLDPLDKVAILQAAETGFVVTVEEHSVNGGLGSAVASVLAQEKPTRMWILGLPDEPLYNGASGDVFKHYGLTGDGIARTILSGIQK